MIANDCSLSLPLLGFDAGACEKVASELGLGDGFVRYKTGEEIILSE